MSCKSESYFEIDETGLMFECDLCHQLKFVYPEDIDDKKLFETALEGEDFICGECFDKLENGEEIRDYAMRSALRFLKKNYEGTADEEVLRVRDMLKEKIEALDTWGLHP